VASDDLLGPPQLEPAVTRAQAGVLAVLLDVVVAEAVGEGALCHRASVGAVRWGPQAICGYVAWRRRSRHPSRRGCPCTSPRTHPRGANAAPSPACCSSAP